MAADDNRFAFVKLKMPNKDIVTVLELTHLWDYFTSP